MWRGGKSGSMEKKKGKKGRRARSGPKRGEKERGIGIRRAKDADLEWIGHLEL